MRSFRNADIEAIFKDQPLVRFQAIQRAARRKPLALDAAPDLRVLAINRGAHLEVLKKERAGQHHIRINDQWPIITDTTVFSLRYSSMYMSKTLTPIHPGEILLEEFLKPLDINPHQLAMALRVPPNRITQIIDGARAISADTALRLGRYFGVNPVFWLNLQSAYDLRVASRERQAQIERDVQPRAE